MAKVTDIVKEIQETRNNVSSCVKDEQRVMMAMLNDPDYKVDVYKSTGIVGSYCPYEEARRMISGIIKDTTKITNKEAVELASNYEFTKSDADVMIGIGKEFVNAYLETGRKLPLGGREKSNVALELKENKEKVNSYPKKVGVGPDGKDIYETVKDGIIPAHNTVRVHGSCPSWLK